MKQEYKSIIAKLIKLDGISESQIFEAIGTPPDKSMGDYALPCFKFAGALRKSPVAIANEIAASLLNPPPPITRVEAVNGFVNFYFDKSAFTRTVLSSVLEKKTSYGGSDEGIGKTICIDYSSINIAKPFHIGHLLTTVIGGALYKIYQKLGYKCVGINHLGDYGTQFGKLIVAFKKWSSEEILSARGMKCLTEIYVKFHDEAAKDSRLDDEARAWFKKIEDGDVEASRLFNLFKEVTLREVQKTYDRLKITFDSYNGEAFFNDKMDIVLDELDDAKLLVESEGAKVVDLSEYKMPPCLLVKADGATLYATRDLAAAYYRKKTYDFDKCIYVVAYQQNLHFQQVFKVLELLGKPWANDLVHVAFGMVSLEDGAMSTRKGNVVLLEDVLDKASEKALAIIKEKSPDLADKESTAEIVGTGAVIFGALFNNRIKDTVFSYDRALNFDGETAPYVQYTNARCLSVLERVGGFEESEIDYRGLDNEESNDVIAALSDFPDAIKEAAEKFEPCVITRNLTEICRAYNRFYIACRILGEAKGILTARAALTRATHTVLEEGLRLLGIGAPQKM